jgi:hypothetical protein
VKAWTPGLFPSTNVTLPARETSHPRAGQTTSKSQWALCHEYRRSPRRCATIGEWMRNYTGVSKVLQFDNQVLISSRRELLWSRPRLVNVAEKAGYDCGRHAPREE